MLSTARSRAVSQIFRTAQVSARRAYAYSANDKQEVKVVPNVSKSNELPTETLNQAAPIHEKVEDAEKMRVMQAPNRATVWSKSQNPRPRAMSGPRFEQTMMQFQVRFISFMFGHGEFQLESLHILGSLLTLFVARSGSRHQLDPQAASTMDPQEGCRM
jgi:hypothetical protein